MVTFKKCIVTIPLSMPIPRTWLPSFPPLRQHFYVSCAFSETFFAYITKYLYLFFILFVHFIYTNNSLLYLLFFTLSFSFIMYLGDHSISDYKEFSLSFIASWVLHCRIVLEFIYPAPCDIHLNGFQSFAIINCCNDQSRIFCTRISVSLRQKRHC